MFWINQVPQKAKCIVYSKMRFQTWYLKVSLELFRRVFVLPVVFIEPLIFEHLLSFSTQRQQQLLYLKLLVSLSKLISAAPKVIIFLILALISTTVLVALISIVQFPITLKRLSVSAPGSQVVVSVRLFSNPLFSFHLAWSFLGLWFSFLVWSTTQILGRIFRH